MKLQPTIMVFIILHGMVIQDIQKKTRCPFEKENVKIQKTIKEIFLIIWTE